MALCLPWFRFNRASIAMLDTLVADLIDLRLTARSPRVGTQLRDQDMPGGARVALVVRDGQSFVPDGDMVLTAGDVLLLAVAPNTAPDTLTEWATQQP